MSSTTNTPETEPQQEKKGFVKSPRKIEMILFGPNSPLPDKWRVFNFIKYRIQDNKRKVESEYMSRDYIIANTGIYHSNFNRIIKSLEADKLITVQRGTYRDSAAMYQLNSETFGETVISPDISASDTDFKMKSDFKSDVAETDSNFKMKSESEVELQNEVGQHQNEVETPLSMAELLRISSLRSPIPLDPLNLTRSPRGETGESFTPLGNVIGIGTGNGIETGDINKEKPKPNFKIPEQKALYTHFTTPDKNDRYREWLTTHPNADVEFEEWSARN